MNGRRDDKWADSLYKNLFKMSDHFIRLDTLAQRQQKGKQSFPANWWRVAAAAAAGAVLLIAVVAMSLCR